MRRRMGLVLLALAIGACGDNTLSAEQACDEQAATWCALAPAARGYTFDCEAVYRADCAAGLGDVQAEPQLACLDAIVANERPSCVPGVCRATWGSRDELKHFCTD